MCAIFSTLQRPYSHAQVQSKAPQIFKMLCILKRLYIFIGGLEHIFLSVTFHSILSSVSAARRFSTQWGESGVICHLQVIHWLGMNTSNLQSASYINSLRVRTPDVSGPAWQMFLAQHWNIRLATLLSPALKERNPFRSELEKLRSPQIHCYTSLTWLMHDAIMHRDNTMQQVSAFGRVICTT